MPSLPWTDKVATPNHTTTLRGRPRWSDLCTTPQGPSPPLTHPSTKRGWHSHEAKPRHTYTYTHHANDYPAAHRPLNGMPCGSLLMHKQLEPL